MVDNVLTIDSSLKKTNISTFQPNYLTRKEIITMILDIKPAIYQTKRLQ